MRSVVQDDHAALISAIGTLPPRQPRASRRCKEAGNTAAFLLSGLAVMGDLLAGAARRLPIAALLNYC
jgi:hypothetical protein